MKRRLEELSERKGFSWLFGTIPSFTLYNYILWFSVDVFFNRKHLGISLSFDSLLKEERYCSESLLSSYLKGRLNWKLNHSNLINSTSELAHQTRPTPIHQTPPRQLFSSLEELRFPTNEGVNSTRSSFANPPTTSKEAKPSSQFLIKDIQFHQLILVGHHLSYPIPNRLF